MNKNLKRFIDYITIDTQSDGNSTSSPSTLKQFDLANLLITQLKELKLHDIELTNECIVYATLPSNLDYECPVIGFNAHLDTSSDCSGNNIKPQIIENYDGKDIILSKEKKIILSSSQFPNLKNKISHTLVTTDGNTLLGADDKAGITIIMSMLHHLVTHPEIKHGTIKIAFTPDEEIGRGTENFDVKKWGADFAYTLDGGNPSLVEYENFNAASASIKINGVSIHPGTAKDKMINANEVAMELHSLLPFFEKPQFTEGYQGFNHLTSLSGGVETATMHYIIRNHDKALLQKQKEIFITIKDYLNNKYQYEIIELTIKDSYKNMKEYLLDKMYVVDIAYQALKNIGYEPISSPIRGGTDGASITYQGTPCPNLGTGGYNYHGKFEYLDLNELEDMIKVVLEIIKITSTYKN